MEFSLHLVRSLFDIESFNCQKKMGVCQSSNPKAKDHYNLAPSSSQGENRDFNQQHPRLSLDPAAIEVEMSDTEGDSGAATPLKSETVPIRFAEKKVPSSPFVPKHLLEGRSFLQSPLGKKKPLREFCDSPTRNRLSGRQFNDGDTVKTRIFRD